METIGSDRTVILKASKYNLLDSTFTGENAYYEGVYDGKQLVIANVSNLAIKAADGNRPGIRYRAEAAHP